MIIHQTARSFNSLSCKIILHECRIGIRLRRRPEQRMPVALGHGGNPIKNLANRCIAPQFRQYQQPDSADDERLCTAEAHEIRQSIAFDTGPKYCTVTPTDQISISTTA